MYVCKIFRARVWCIMNTIKGEMYEGKKCPLEKNLTYFLKEFTYIFLPLEIKVFF